MKEVLICWESLCRYFRLNPAVSLLCALVSGVISPWLVVVPLLVMFASGRRRLIWLFFLAGCLLSFAHRHHPWQTYRKYLRHPNSVASVRGRIEGESAPGRRPRVPFRIEAVLREGVWHPCNGRALAVLPAPVPKGTRVEADGAFLLLREGGSYADWLQSRGIYTSFVVHELRTLSPPPEWSLMRFRDGLKERLLSGINSPEKRGVFAAMMLGVREELPPDVKDAFIKSATVHIFSISGLHVGLLFGCLTLVLRICCIQSRLRLAIVLPIIGLYVLLCGAMPSALRAYFMLVVLTGTDWQWRVRAPENALAIAAIVLLCANPLFLKHTGFIFSFTLVATLLRSRMLSRQLTEILTEKQYWLPYAKRRIWHLKAWFISFFLGGISAWLGCTGLMMRYNGMISFSSLGVNLAMLPAASLLAACALLKLLWNGAFLAYIVEKLLGFMLLMSRLGAAAPLHAEGAPISFPVMLLYYAALLFFFSSVPVRLRSASLAVIVGIIVCFCVRHPRNMHIQASASDGRLSSSAYIDSSSQVHILQPGGYSALKSLGDVLANLGATQVESIYVPPKSDAYALERIIASTPPRRIVFSPQALRSPRLRTLFRKLKGTGINTSIGPPLDEIPASPEGPPPSLFPEIRVSPELPPAK